ncbi:MAG: phosphonate metabolism protein/1,5-bisphosphokinase (PRPP-forming) PhnN [Rhodospirillaceae bacterium]|nr:phosphonate metabolism protein/1,5-bisphosphokinase (PRPP-forming) PhnN [Rhodospirillaceae bacterium]
MRRPAEAGRLIYVMGASGSGKDSLINYVRERLAERRDDCIVIAQRYITRPPETKGERHLALSPACFAARQLAGDFAMSWSANGLEYGIGREIDDSLRSGRHVIVNGSRAHFPEAVGRYPTALPILIVVDPILLQARLLARGRESADEIAARIARAGHLTVQHPTLQVIQNDGPISGASEAFLDVIRRLPGINERS